MKEVKSSNISLVVILDTNEESTNSVNLGVERRYFDEAIKCFKSWRKNGGWLKDINIYGINCTKRKFSELELNQLEELKVTYIEDFMEETENFEIGFFSVPLAIAKYENKFKENILIHIDLDMDLIKEIPKSLIEQVNENTIICGQYDDVSKKYQRKYKLNPSDTGFTISLGSSNFYKFYWKVTRNILEGNITLPKELRIYDIEEYAMDIINGKEYDKTGIHNFNILGIQKYQLGEGYSSIDNFSDEEIENVYFWHEHIQTKPSIEMIKEKIKFNKRKRKS